MDYRHNYKKRYGQNFLSDESILRKISSNKLNNKLKCVEIGAGLGDLTEFLIQETEVLSFEVDKELKSTLSQKFKEEISNKKLELIFKDILDVWTDDNLLQKPYQLIANLPYYISKKIILKALQDNNCKYILIMIQKEVALKFSAKKNDRNFCALSVISQLLCEDINILFDVGAEMFTPSPNVMSSVISFKRENEYDKLPKDFLDFLKIAFSAPRKKLISNITKSPIYDKDKVKDIFDLLDIDSNLRPHQVGASQYEKIYDFIKKGPPDT